MLSACAGNNSSGSENNVSNKVNSFEEVEVLDNLIVHAKVKDNAEYIPVDQYTSVEDFHPEDYLDIEINQDVDYRIEWVGQALSWRFDDYNEIISGKYKKKLLNPDMIMNLKTLGADEITNLSKKTIENINKTTLDSEGFRGITIYILINNGESEISIPVDANLLILPDELNGIVEDLDNQTIENAQRAIYEYYINTYPEYIREASNKGFYPFERFKGMPYISNIG